MRLLNLAGKFTLFEVEERALCDLAFCRVKIQLNDRPNGLRYCDDRKRAIRRSGENPAQELHSGKTANPYETITFVLFRKPIARCRLC
jgi:hypothetical protein